MNLAYLRRYILLIAGRLLKWTTISGLSSKWGYLRVTMPQPVDDAEGVTSNTQPCRNMNAFGFRSAPASGSECIVGAPRGGATNAVVVASDHLGYGPTDLAEGDSVQFSKAHHEGKTCMVRVDASGKITIHSKGNGVVVIDENGKITIDAVAGQDVVVNGGTLQVARKTDPVAAAAAMTTWMAAVNTAITNLIALNPAVAPGAGPGTIGNINDGAARFKA